jgi:hypothetical protein
MKEQEAQKAGSVTFNIGNIGNAVGIGVFGDNANINATQSLTIGELAASALRLADQTERAVGSSDLPEAIKAETGAALVELRAAAAEGNVDGTRVKKALGTLKNVMEHAAGHVVAAGVLALIAMMLSKWPF